VRRGGGRGSSDGMFLAAAVQLNCSSDPEKNWASARDLIERAASYGAKLVATPENTNFLGPHAEKVRTAEPIDGPTIGRFRELAARHGLHLLVGSFNEVSAVPGRCHNTSVLIGPAGEILGSYRKIHLFDVDVPPDVHFVESDTVAPGAEPVVVDTALGRVGLSVCYDLRFGELYRALVAQGAQIITIPSAFTLTTGKDHWHALIRARAIETQCYVVAPGQSGRHDDQGLRHSYGHSLIVDPWGQEVGCSSDGPGLALAEVDLGRVASVRRSIPVQSHRRLGG
jgi:predicted amidohydrolase